MRLRISLFSFTAVSLSCLLACSCHDHQDEKTTTLRKVRMKELSAEIAIGFLENPGWTTLDELLQDRRPDLSVLNSSNRFRINQNVVLWKSFASNSTDEVAIYFSDDTFPNKAWGKTFKHEFVEFDPRGREEKFY